MFDGQIDYRRHEGLNAEPLFGSVEEDFLMLKELQVRMFKGVGDDEVLLGTYENWTENPDSELFKIPHDFRRRLTATITGDNDSGKTTLFNSVVYDQLHARAGRLTAAIDPKEDSVNLPFPNTTPAFVKMLAKLNISPAGYPITTLYSKGMLGVDGIQFVPSLRNFDAADEATSIDRLAEFFDLKGDDSKKALGLLAAAMNEHPETYEELIAKAKSIREGGVAARVEKLEDNIRLKVLEGSLTNEFIDIPKLLHETGILVLRVPNVKEQRTAILASIFISNLLAARELFIRTGKGYGDRPITLALDEADKYAGTNTLANALITQTTTKFRAIHNVAGLDSILSSQHPSNLDEQQVMESDIVVGTRLSTEDDKKVMRNRVGVKLWRLQNTEFVMGQHPKQFWFSDKNGQVETFYPLPTRLSMKKVGA